MPVALPTLEDQAQLTSRVLAVLRDAIAEGRLAPGERIKQELIARDLGVSRTPVREALHLLESEGLIQLIPRRGAIVQALTRADVVDLCELRLVLEPHAAANAAERATPRERRDVTKLAVETAKSGGDAFATNRAFHAALCAPCGNRMLMKSLDGIWSHYSALRLFNEQTRTAHAFIVIGREHAEIGDAFASGEAARVRTLVHDHIRAAGDDVLARLTEETL